jgi:peroxiredoxin
MPSLARLYDEFKQDGFVVLAIDIGETKNTVERYTRKQYLPFPVLLDTDGRVAQLYGVGPQPDHFLINGQGEVIGRTLGGRDWMSKEIRNLISSLVEQNNVKMKNE